MGITVLPRDFYRAVVLAERWGINARERLAHWEALAEAGRMEEAERDRVALLRETAEQSGQALGTLANILRWKIAVSVVAALGTFIYLKLSS